MKLMRENVTADEVVEIITDWIDYTAGDPSINNTENACLMIWGMVMLAHKLGLEMNPLDAYMTYSKMFIEKMERRNRDE